MTQRDSTGIEPKISVERVDDLRAADLSDLCDAAEHAITDGGGFGWLAPPPRDVLEAYWRGVLLIPERDLLIGRLDDVIAGSCQLLRPTRNNEAQSFSCNLTTHFVAPWARGHGLSAELIRAAEDRAIETDFDLLNLDVRETQIAAIRLFEGLGYSRFGEHPYYARVGQNYVKGCFYFKKLNEENSEDM